MGIRPSVYLLVGIDDLQFDAHSYNITDLRYKERCDWQGSDNTIAIPDQPEWSDDDLTRRQSFRYFLELNRVITLRESLKRRADDDGRVRLHNLIQYNNEYGLGNVIGYIVDELPYNHLVTWAMAVNRPELQSSYVERVQSLPLDEDYSTDAQCLRIWREHRRLFDERDPSTARSEMIKLLRQPKARQWIRGSAHKKRNIQWGWNYPSINTMYEMDTWSHVAMYLFQHIGLHVERRDLKLMLYWRWS